MAIEHKRVDQTLPLKVSLAIFAVFVIILACTCPNKTRHVNLLRDRIVEISKTDADSASFEEDMMVMAISNLVEGHKVEQLLNNNLFLENYVVFNFGVMIIDGEEQIVSIGFFNRVYTASAEEIKNRIVDRLQ